jgi:hypothetical protein
LDIGVKRTPDPVDRGASVSSPFASHPIAQDEQPIAVVVVARQDR